VRKELDLEVVVPVEDMRELGSTANVVLSEHVAAAERTPLGLARPESEFTESQLEPGDEIR